MDWLWLVKQPWFTVSPNIWSMTFYLLCAIAGGRILLAHGARYKRWPVLIAFTDGLFLIGIIVLIQDTGWMLFSTLRWYVLYGSQMSFTGYWIRYPQNLVGLCLLFLLTYGLWKARLVSFTRHTVFWMVIIWFMMGINFMLAPDPSWTDYTWAVRIQAPDWQIFFEFFLSHVVLKVLMALSFLGLFRKNGVEPSSGTLFQSTYKERPRNLSVTEEAEIIKDLKPSRGWDKRARQERADSIRIERRMYCTAKGSAEPRACKSKFIGRSSKGKPGQYAIMCRSRSKKGCPCQSIYPKILRIPILERRKLPVMKSLGRR